MPVSLQPFVSRLRSFWRPVALSRTLPVVSTPPNLFRDDPPLYGCASAERDDDLGSKWHRLAYSPRFAPQGDEIRVGLEARGEGGGGRGRVRGRQASGNVRPGRKLRRRAASVARGQAGAGPCLDLVEFWPVQAAECLEVLQGARFLKGLCVELDGGVRVEDTRTAARALLAAWGTREK